MMDMQNIDLHSRSLQPDDLDLICQHREKMFLEAGRSPDAVRLMTDSFRPWLRTRLADGRYFGFFLTVQDQVVAGIGLMEIEWPPHPSHPEQDKRAYMLNVYVEPAFRKRGLAKQMMQLAEQEFTRRGLQFAILHATAAGRPLYENLGWSGTTEMAKHL
jgi:ribosomal protein S18 acetylase RimI-like enzyme